MLKEYGSVKLNKKEREIINDMVKNGGIPKKYKVKNKDACYGLPFNATRFFLNYYHELAEKHHSEARKLEALKGRWSWQYDCEIFPD